VTSSVSRRADPSDGDEGAPPLCSDADATLKSSPRVGIPRLLVRFFAAA